MLLWWRVQACDGPAKHFQGPNIDLQKHPRGLSRVQHFWVQNETWLQRPAQNWPECQYSAATMSVPQKYRFSDGKNLYWDLHLCFIYFNTIPCHISTLWLCKHTHMHTCKHTRSNATTDKDTGSPASSSPFWKFPLHSKGWLGCGLLFTLSGLEGGHS